MARFAAHWDIASTLPDSHLVDALWIPTPRGIRSDQFFLAGHVHPDLLRDLDEYFRHLGHSGAYEMHPELAKDPPEFHTEYERVDPNLLPLRTFGVRISGKHYTFCVRADMMSAPLVAEINTDFLPARQGALRTQGSVPEPARPAALDLLDQYGERGLAFA